MSFKKRQVLVVLFLLYYALSGSANEQIGSYMNEYYEVLALAGIVERPALIFKSLSRSSWQLPPEGESHPWISRMEREKTWNQAEGVNWNFISPQLLISYNTSYAHGSNDGAFWQGRGINTLLSGGANLSWNWLSATLDPELWFAYNQEFDLMPPNSLLSEYSYPAGQIDYPQRFGDDPVIGYGFGQSDVRLNIRWFTLGLSHENLWFGSAKVNPILMSNNASGFPHIDIGIRRVNTFLGDIEFNLVWGALMESDYFDEDETNNYRLFSSGTFAYSPFFLDGLTLGISRVMHTTWEDLNFNDFMIVFDPQKPGIGDDRDQMISFLIDWFLTEAMCNVYLEWARNDYSPDLRWALSYPQHSQGYTIGFRKLLLLNVTKLISITAEITQLVRTQDADNVGGSYYRHNIVTQGYTHLGQIMGTAIGPGSNSQFLQGSYYGEWGSIGASLQRIAYDQDYYFANFTRPDSENVEWIVGIDGVVFLTGFDLGFELSVSDNWNRNYVKKNDVWNLYGMLSVKYNF